MAIANDTTGIWVNDDGLRWKFAGAEAVKGKSGEYRENTSTHVSEFDLDFTTVARGTADTTVQILDYDSVFPNGAVIEKVTFKVGTAWAGSGCTINVGLVARSNFTTITDADGIIANVAITVLDTAGAVYSVYQEGVATYAGVLLGTALASDSVLSVNYNTAAPTAGTAKMYVEWRFAA